MAIKKYNPTSPARRFMTVSDFAEITKKSPERSLLLRKTSTPAETHTVESLFVIEAAATEESTELLTLREIKTVCRQQLSVLNTIRTEVPNIALIQYEDGEKAYIIALSVLQTVTS